jgi:hypothetical protein
MEVKYHAFFKLVLDDGEMSALGSDHFKDPIFTKQDMDCSQSCSGYSGEEKSSTTPTYQ